MRTEEQKVLKSPIVVILGGQDYQIEPLCIREAREWRKQFASLLAKLPSYAQTTSDKPEAFEGAVTGMLCTMPNAMCDLFFAYAKGLDRDEIEGKATEAELAKAIEAIIEVAFPLLRSLTGAMGKLSQ